MKMRLKIILLSLFWLIISAQVFAQDGYQRANLWQKEIAAFGESDKFPQKTEILFTGSSSIRLWQTLQNDFPKYQVLNRGFGGSQIEDVNFYAPEIVVPHKPKLIVIYAGDNDLNDGKTPAQVLTDFKRFVEIVHEKLPLARIIYISIKPSPARWNLRQQFREANSLIKTETLKDKRLQFVDVWQPMLNEKGEPKAEIFQDDQLHMNANGYKIWQAALAPYLKKGTKGNFR